MTPFGWVSNLFPNAYHVARREFNVRVRNRTFAVITVILAVVGAGLTLLPVGVRVLGGDKPAHLAVYSTVTDLDTSVAATLEAALNALANGTASSGSQATARFQVREVSDPVAERDLVRTDKLDGLLTVTRGPDGDLAFDLFSKDTPKSERLALIRTAANGLAVSDRLKRAGVTVPEQQRISAPVAFRTTAADPDAARRNQEDFVPAYILATIFVVLMFMAIQVYGNWVAGSVAEEKSSRVMELLISAATPRQLLLGKVLGNGAAGLAQYAVILVAALVGYLLQGRLAEKFLGDTNAAAVPGLTPTRLHRARRLLPGRLPPLRDPVRGGRIDGEPPGGHPADRRAAHVHRPGRLPHLARGAQRHRGRLGARSSRSCRSSRPSCSPPRMLLSDVAPWEYVVVIGLIVIAILGALWVAARIYEAGVLLYGQRPTIRAMMRAAFARR